MTNTLHTPRQHNITRNERNKTLYFYIMQNPNWIHTAKYGYTTNLRQTLEESIIHHSKMSTYVKVFPIVADTTHIKPNQYISRLGRAKTIPQNLKYMNKIGQYLINDGGSSDFIHKDGLFVLIGCILTDFPQLNIGVSEELSSQELVKINNIYIEEFNSSSSIFEVVALLNK